MEKKEKCGLVGAYSAKGSDVAPSILQGLESLQHRGQESWGLAVEGNALLRRMGLVTNWHVDAAEAASYKGKSGIGHVRYSTKGRSVLENAQPIQIESEFSIAHNGTIVNADQLAAPVTKEFGASCESDTMAAGYRLLHHLRETGSMFEAFAKLSREIFGAYCFMILDKEGRVFAARDPRGYRPLSLGWDRGTETFLAASESCALEAMGSTFVRDIEPGEIVMLGPNEGTPESFRFSPKVAPAYCSFEYTYFAHPSSRLNGVSVYETRKRVGRILARRFKTRADVVIPVPDSARPAALGFALESGIPMDEGLMKDRYRRKGSIRSFIEPEQGGREEVVRKIIPVRDAVVGRDVLVVDDSLVRGTSSKIIVEALRNAGAKTVRMAVTFPAIRHPCFMGIDFPDREELLAHRVARGEQDAVKTANEVAKAVGVDEFYYNDVVGLSEAIGLPEDSLCFACVTGDYSKLGFRPPVLAKEEVGARDA
ncbi:MAG TPA: amidophosphoribosyltransferase [Nitrososphaerales archaeon]|nr:amidophosphoribosyltransferase [Nitrososphaerales archaeon]